MEDMKYVTYYTDAKGNKIPVELDLNENLKNNSKLKRRLMAGSLVLISAGGIAVGIAHLINHLNVNNLPDREPKAVHGSKNPEDLGEATPEKTTDLRYNPNSKEAITEQAIYLIKEAAKNGKELDPEDAVLTVVAANSKELSYGFMGELFGQQSEQTYAAEDLVNAYIRVGLMVAENVGIATDEATALNMENIFANPEDFEFLCQNRNLTIKFNNSKDDADEVEITQQLNEICRKLCTYETFDKSSAASILSMLSLDGMRIVTNNSDNVILPDDIRDEMFGTGDYYCSPDAKPQYTQYANRVNDFREKIGIKLERAKGTGAPTIKSIIKNVNEATKDVVIEKDKTIEMINEKREENRTTSYEYETSPGVVKPEYSEKTQEDQVIVVDGQEVVVEPSNKSNQVESNQQQFQEEKVEENKQQAEQVVQDKAILAQDASNSGAADAKVDAESGSKRSVEETANKFGEYASFYIKAYNTAYPRWLAVYHPTVEETTNTVSVDNANETVEEVSLDDLSKEQLLALRTAALGDTNIQSENTKSK